MALQSSGPISFSQIANEFGTPPGKNLGAYRVSQTVSGLSNLALDNEVNNVGIVTAIMPQSGTIRFSDFYSKKLNIVVNCSGNKVIARNRYDNNNNVFSIGGFKGRPASSSGTRVWIHTNTIIGSNLPSRFTSAEYSSLLTGSWNSNTDLRVDIGPDGIVTGAGGNGGAGGSAGSKFSNPGQTGLKGTTGLGIQYSPVIITNRGRIQGGGGGGGGGGGSWNQNRRRNERDLAYAAGGGGGGGGWGLPAGQGGAGGSSTAADGNDPGDRGGDGTLLLAGTGGTGGGTGRDSGGGGGGGGANGAAGVNGNDPGIAQPNPTAGNTTSGGNGGPGRALGGNDGDNELRSPGGSGFVNGFSIVVFNDGSGVSIQNNNTIVGVTTYNISPN